MPAGSKRAFSQILKEIDTFVFDCDGVVWRGNSAIVGAVALVNKLKALGKAVYFVSNNSIKTREQYFEKFAELGFSEVQREQIFSTSVTAAMWLQRNVERGGRVYAIGNDAVKTELELAGVNAFGFGSDTEVTRQDFDAVKDIHLEEDVKAVLVAVDGHFSFTKLIKAASYLRDPTCKFVVTNEDDRFPLPDSRHVVVATGSIVAAVKCASAREPDVVCGKPHAFMYECFSGDTKLNVARTMMIGDNLETDVPFGNRNGMRTLLVLSGVTSVYNLRSVCSEAGSQEKVPDYFMNSLNDWNDD